MKQTRYGHSAFRIEAGEAKILIDPFLSDNPSKRQRMERLPYRQKLDTGR
jgi:L-ascorbate metabolism protein UlaG (beta-lactamase superfamily)